MSIIDNLCKAINFMYHKLGIRKYDRKQLIKHKRVSSYCTTA